MSAPEMVTVCAACGYESCWNGILYCEDYRTAGTRQVPRRSIQELIERSSLGTPEAKAFRAQTPARVARAVVERLEMLTPGEANELTIIVRGLPAAQGSKRHVGKGVMVESSKALKPWREAVKYAALELDLDSRPYYDNGPLAMRAVFTFPRPKSHYRTGKHAHELRPDAPVYKSSTPDGSKLLRSTEDALTDAGIWRDDAQVADSRGIKKYGPVAGATITIRPLNGTP